MSQEPVSALETPAPNTISPKISLWTIQEFDRDRQENTKFQLIFTGIGIVLLLVGMWILSRSEGNAIGGIMALVGLYLVALRWLFRLVNNKGPSFESRRRATGKYEIWNRNVKCPGCGHETTINIGYVEYNCLDCGSKNSIASGIDYMNAKIASTLTDGIRRKGYTDGLACWKCTKPNPLLDRPAKYVCPNCKNEVDLEKFPA
jgi:DNA-directed RNA polymerase subunit RPC12/RpoP